MLQANVAGVVIGVAVSGAIGGIQAELVFSRSVGDQFNVVDTTRYAVGDGGHVAFAVSENLIGSETSLRVWLAGSTSTITSGSERITSLGVDGQGRVAYASTRQQFGNVAESFVRVGDTGGVTLITSQFGSPAPFDNTFAVRSFNGAGQLGVQRGQASASVFNVDPAMQPEELATSFAVEPGQFNNVFAPFVLDNGNALVQAARAAQASTRVYGWDAESGELSLVINTFDQSSAIVNIDGAFAASGSGNVAVIGAARGAAGERIVLFDGNGLRTLNIADAGGELTNLGRVSVNDSATVLFTAVTPGSTNLAIYAWRGGETTRLLSAGDALFGSTVQELDISTESLNDAGRFAFYFRLADGRSGYATALVPAPATGCFMAGLGFLAARRRR